MVEHYYDIPPNIGNILTEEFLDRWKGQVPETNPDKAKESIEERFTYLLQMFWQARFDKMHMSHKAVFDWVSGEFLPADANYKGISHRQLLIITTHDHGKLAKDVFDKVWDLYEATPESGLVREEKPSLMGRVLGMFR